jgi:hypothetical protein
MVGVRSASIAGRGRALWARLLARRTPLEALSPLPAVLPWARTFGSCGYLYMRENCTPLGRGLFLSDTMTLSQRRVLLPPVSVSHTCGKSKSLG